jgi:hypothetical protein
MTTPNDPITFSCADAEFVSIKPPTSFIFQGEQGEIGRLSWGDGTFRFTGNADESAKLFFSCLNQLIPQTKAQDEAHEH